MTSNKLQTELTNTHGQTREVACPKENKNANKEN